MRFNTGDGNSRALSNDFATYIEHILNVLTQSDQNKWAFKVPPDE